MSTPPGELLLIVISCIGRRKPMCGYPHDPVEMYRSLETAKRTAY